MDFAGLDVHKESVQACVLDAQGNVLTERRFDTSPVGLDELLETVRNSSCVMEASTACYPVYDFLSEHNVKVRVAHPKATKAIWAGKKSTDKVDAKMLAHLERTNLVPEAYVPSKVVRQQWDLVAHHVDLTQQKTRLNNQTSALLLKNSVRLPWKWFTKRSEKLLPLMKLPESLLLKVTHAKQQHALLKVALKEVDSRITALAMQNKNAVLLHSIRGVGWFGAFLISVRIDKIERFSFVDKLVSYAGLCPSIKQSGETTRFGKIGNDCCKASVGF